MNITTKISPSYRSKTAWVFSKYGALPPPYCAMLWGTIISTAANTATTTAAMIIALWATRTICHASKNSLPCATQISNSIHCSATNAEKHYARVYAGKKYAQPQSAAVFSSDRKTTMLPTTNPTIPMVGSCFFIAQVRQLWQESCGVTHYYLNGVTQMKRKIKFIS